MLQLGRATQLNAVGKSDKGILVRRASSKLSKQIIILLTRNSNTK